MSENANKNRKQIFKTKEETNRNKKIRINKFTSLYNYIKLDNLFIS